MRLKSFRERAEEIVVGFRFTEFRDQSGLTMKEVELADKIEAELRAVKEETIQEFVDWCQGKARITYNYTKEAFEYATGRWQLRLDALKEESQKGNVNGNSEKDKDVSPIS